MALPTPILLTVDEAEESSSVSPTGGALVLVAAATFDTSNIVAVTDISSSFSVEGGWTEAVTSSEDSGGSSQSGFVSFWWAIASSTPGSGTVSATLDGTPKRTIIHVIEIDGAPSSPIAQTASDSDPEGTNNSSPSLTLTETPAAGSITLGAIVGNDTSFTPGASFTELAEVGSTQTQYDVTSPTDTIDWSGVNNGANRPIAYVGLEVAEADEAVSVSLGFGQAAATGYPLQVEQAPQTRTLGVAVAQATGFPLSVEQAAQSRTLGFAAAPAVGYPLAPERTAQTRTLAFGQAQATGYPLQITEGTPGADTRTLGFGQADAVGFPLQLDITPRTRQLGFGRAPATGYPLTIDVTGRERTLGFALAPAAGWPLQVVDSAAGAVRSVVELEARFEYVIDLKATFEPTVHLDAHFD